jgi:hypothetical protein
MVLFPTPPLAEETATIFDTFWIFRFWGSPRCARGRVGGAFFLGRPYVEFSKPPKSSLWSLTKGFSWLRCLTLVEKHLRILTM